MAVEPGGASDRSFPGDLFDMRPGIIDPVPAMSARFPKGLEGVQDRTSLELINAVNREVDYLPVAPEPLSLSRHDDILVQVPTQVADNVFR